MSLCAAEAHPDYFKKIREICDKYNVLLILDEVMTGWGRTGEMFAYQHYGIVPDMVSTGKAVSGGYYPLAAVSVTKEFYDGYHETGQKFKPGYSWSGNPTGAAAQLAAYKYMNEHNLLENCRVQGAYLKKRISEIAEKHPIMGDIRGKGLMVGIELVKDKETKEPFDPKLGMASQVQDECLDAQNMIIEASTGCYKGTSGDALVISPAFVVTKDEVDMIVDKLDRAITTVEGRNGIN
jgi:adenosylmethionine-8-amino-7-oxononanoate aminotransferase